MDTNFSSNNLNQLFQDVTLTSVNDRNVLQIETFLTNLIDSNDYEVFNSPIFMNFIFLLDSSETSFIIKHLIREIKLKSLRLVYTSKQRQDNEIVGCSMQEEELPLFTDLPSLPPPGETSFARQVYQENGNEIIKTYLIDHTGQALKLVNVETNEYESEFATLNDNVIERAVREVNGKDPLSSLVPLTEDDL